MMDICFGIHDNNGKYSKYMAATMCSIISNTSEEITFHVLHDSSLDFTLQKNLTDMLDRHEKVNLKFYKMDIDESLFENYDLKRFTVGTLFKLKICEQLTDVTDKAIYLDSDIVVNLDIKELWDQELDDKSIGAVHLPIMYEAIVPLLKNRIVPQEEYFNTGLMLLNIKKINKKYRMWEECLEFILNHPELWRAPDQDAISYIFRGDIKGIPDKYNVRVSDYRKAPGNEKCIFHFIADSPRDTYESLPDRLFLDALRMTPWGTDDLILEHYEKRLAEKDLQKDVVYKLMKAVYSESSSKKVFWGVRGDIHEEIMNKLPINEGDYFVDKNKAKWGDKHMGLEIKSPDVLKDEDVNNTVVIVTVFRYNEIRPVLESYGYKENENFFNGKYLLPEKITYTMSGERDNKWDL